MTIELKLVCKPRALEQKPMSSISDPRAQVALRLVNMIGQGPCGSEPIGASSAKSLRIRVIILPLGSAWLLRIDLPNKPWSASPRERRWSGMLTWCPFVQPAGPMDVLSFLFSVLSSRTVSAVKEAPRQQPFRGLRSSTEDMDDPGTPLIGRFGHCSQARAALSATAWQELVNLLLIGNSAMQRRGPPGVVRLKRRRL